MPAVPSMLATRRTRQMLELPSVGRHVPVTETCIATQVSVSSVMMIDTASRDRFAAQMRVSRAAEGMLTVRETCFPSVSMSVLKGVAAANAKPITSVVSEPLVRCAGTLFVSYLVRMVPVTKGHA